jgi:hypothetical protein
MSTHPTSQSPDHTKTLVKVVPLFEHIQLQIRTVDGLSTVTLSDRQARVLGEQLLAVTAAPIYREVRLDEKIIHTDQSLAEDGQWYRVSRRLVGRRNIAALQLKLRRAA